HICLPAELKGGDDDNVLPVELKENYVNGLLDPLRLSRPILESFRNVLGTKSYTGQYLQRPAPDEGGIFKREWFDIIPATSVVRDSINNPIHFVLDTAYTEK